MASISKHWAASYWWRILLTWARSLYAGFSIMWQDRFKWAARHSYAAVRIFLLSFVTHRVDVSVIARRLRVYYHHASMWDRQYLCPDTKHGWTYSEATTTLSSMVLWLILWCWWSKRILDPIHQLLQVDSFIFQSRLLVPIRSHISFDCLYHHQVLPILVSFKDSHLSIIDLEYSCNPSWIVLYCCAHCWPCGSWSFTMM